MHDDQHGTAVVVLAALTNAAKVTGRTLESLRVVVSGAGAAGIAVAEILLTAGIGDVVLLDSRGTISKDRADIAADPASKKAQLAARSNPRGVTGGPGEALLGADVFVGVSSSKLDEEHLKLMNHSSIVFALSNPDPEVLPEVAASTRPWSPPDAATSRTRSTTSWPSPASSAAPSTPAPAGSRRP